MDWKTFTVNIIDSLVWPIIILVIILIFCKPIRDLLKRIASLNYKNFSMGFSEGVKELKEYTTRKEIDETQKVITEASIPFSELLQQSPRAAILIAWSTFENMLLDKAQVLGITNINDGQTSGFLRVMHAMRKHTTLDRKAYMLYRKLHQLKSKIVFNNSMVSSEEAADFIQSTEILISLIDKATLIES